MACKFCPLQYGTRLTLHASGDTECCNAAIDEFSIPVIYQGKVGSEHRFFAVEPFDCPGCGKVLRDLFVECPDDGVLIELPVAIELPVEREV